MAGSFSDVPGYRFAYDVDGTIGVIYSYSGGVIASVSSADLSKANQEQASANNVSNSVRVDTRLYVPGGGDNNYVALVFPELRDIAGYFLSVPSVAPTGGKIIQTSSDTTNGQDGTWTTVANPHGGINGNSIALSPAYRTEIKTVEWTSVRAIRFTVTNVFWACHLYGTISTSLSTERLRVTDISDNDIVAQLDMGNIPQRTSATKQLKISNLSATQTANNITVSINTQVNSDSSPSLIGQYQLSTDNIAFANAVNIGNLAPGASTNIYMKASIAANAQLGPWAARIIAHPVSWS
jgi:hypothetical protein